MREPSLPLRFAELPRPADVAVVIPVLNEEQAIGAVLSAIPQWVGQVIVVDNGSTDRTAQIAREHGARVVAEPQRGYGAACLAGLAAIGHPEVVVFLDGDFSDHPEEMRRLVTPILENRADLVVGSRVMGNPEPGALTLAQQFGNALACGLMRFLIGTRYTDLGPFRAIRYPCLKRIGMDDRGYGWTIQMQVRAARMSLRVMEAPVSYRRRVGPSKISGTWRGAIGAGTKILFTICRETRAVLPAAPREKLIVFSRYPEPGRTKTRLIPALGPQRAAELQRQMTSHTLRQARLVARERPVQIEVRFAGGDAPRMRQLYGRDASFLPQGEGDLGQRLYRAAQEAFAAGAMSVTLIGSDCPRVTPEILHAAFDGLRQHDLMLGPAADGGYYLLALRHCWPTLFQSIAWGSDQVCEQTRQAARKLGLSVGILPLLADVDRPEDLDDWYVVSNEASAAESPPQISVVIPALNEERIIGAAISAASALGIEVIVVDGGSTDKTRQVATSSGAKVLTAPAGRAQQMNAGAAAARGEILLFLHADSVLPPNFADHVIRILAHLSTVGGAFALAIDPPGPVMRLLAATTNLRSRWLQMPYGDQAIFVHRATFQRVGGFAALPIMEDIEFLRRLRRMGRIATANATVHTSGRRWQQCGVWRMSLLNQLLLLGYFAGISPDVLYQSRQSARLGPLISSSVQLGAALRTSRQQFMSGVSMSAS